MDDQADVIGTREAAQMLGVSTREVRRKASEGSLTGFLVKGAVRPEWRFERSEVIAYLRGREQIDQDGRTAALAVRQLESVALKQQEVIEAQHEATVASRELAATIAANISVQAGLTSAVGELVTALRDELAAVRADRDRLREELSTVRDELAAARRPWWGRLVGYRTSDGLAARPTDGGEGHGGADTGSGQ